MLNKTKIQISSLALALSLSPTVLADTQELISNGSFENFTVSKDNGNWKLVQFNDWQGEGEVWTSALGKVATDGDYKIELDVGNEINTLSQTVTTVADQKYRFSLDAYARRANSSDFEILLDGNVIVTIKPDSEWAEHEAYFVGTGGDQTISIKELDAQSNGLGTIIDNVSLTESNELIVNGSFENFTVSKDNGRWKLVDFTGWEGVGEVWTNGLGKRSTLGVHKIELDVGRELNTLSQSIATEDGAEYELSLDAYARTKDSSDFELWLDDEKLLAVTPTTDWSRYSVKFFGNGTTQRISIKELGTQSNGLGTVVDNVSLIATGEHLKTAASRAIDSGRVTDVTEQELITATLEELESLKSGDSLLADIYQNGNISYATGGYNSQLINLSGDVKKVFPILYGNKNKVLAVAGVKEQSRFSIFASNPLAFFDKGENLGYEPYMKRIFAWLISGQANDTTTKDSKKTIVLAFEKSSSVSRWIKATYPAWEVKSCHDKLTLASCSTDADLIILGNSGNNEDAEAMKNALPTLIADAKPILYLHPNWGQNSLSQVVADQFDFSFPYGGNYWAKDAANWSDSNAMQASLYANSGYASINKMMQHFQTKDYGFNWSQCVKENCSSVTGLNSDFTQGAKLVYDMMHALDNQKKNIFKTDGYRLQKLLALTGDKFRQGASFPMDKVTSNDTEFMKSYYADHAVYNYRSINPAQADMGNFSRSNFSHITPTRRTVNYTTKNGFRSTGAYALPGQTVSVTRHDSSAVSVKVFVNTQRSGSTHQWASNGYKVSIQLTHV